MECLGVSREAVEGLGKKMGDLGEVEWAGRAARQAAGC
jgi:hypothetical protein